MSMTAKIRREPNATPPFYVLTLEVPGAVCIASVREDEIDLTREQLAAAGWTILDETGQDNVVD